MANDPSDYPVQLSIDYPDRKLSKLSSFFRIFTAIPIAIILGLLSGSSLAMASSWSWESAYGGVVVLPLVLMILFRKKYPK